jgi:di/tricarboxylate transporter
MIVGGDAIEVMSPTRFLFYMTLPTVASYLLTMLWIQRCWMKWRATLTDTERMNLLSSKPQMNNLLHPNGEHSSSHSAQDSVHSSVSTIQPLTINTDLAPEERQYSGLLSPYRAGALEGLASPTPAHPVPVSQKVIRFIITPFPYAMLLLMAVMIALLFVDIISIFGLICLTAVFMVVVLVLGNHWQGLPIWGTASTHHLYHGAAEAEGNSHHKMTSEEKIENTQQFFEELFQSLDYNLLFIFLGLFVVVENIDSTGIPRKIWSSIVGKAPFDTPLSVTLISLFILISSQFLGNVPVIQLAKPNVEMLDDDEKRYAWAILSFVATVGGNLTITGSAANIIVAEKASRIDPSATIDFFRHYQICFWVTLLSCALGAFFITGVITCDNQM